MYENSEGEITPRVRQMKTNIEKDITPPDEVNIDKNVFFENLSKTNIDSKKKLQFLAEQKLRIEMSTCTFKPSINSTRNPRIDS